MDIMPTLKGIVTAPYIEALQEDIQAKPTIQEAYRGHITRNRPGFGVAQFTAEFWNSLRDRFLAACFSS